MRGAAARRGVLGLLALVLGAPAASWAHPVGFHKKLTVTVARTTLDALVVMDVDAGERCALLRAGADVDHDGALSKEETQALSARLVGMATRTLALSISGYRLEVKPRDVKLSLRGDARASDTGVSVAVLLELKLPAAVTPGMSLELEDTSPDGSPVLVQVFQAAAEAARQEAPTQLELAAGQKAKVRLGALAEKRADGPSK